MKTYLLTWNPNKWDWDNLEDEISNHKEKGYSDSRWSCRNKSIKKGDRVFLIRLGEEPKGIIASGFSESIA